MTKAFTPNKEKELHTKVNNSEKLVDAQSFSILRIKKKYLALSRCTVTFKMLLYYFKPRTSDVRF